MNYLLRLKNFKKSKFLAWYYLVAFFLLLDLCMNFNYVKIYLFVIFLLIIRYSFETSALILAIIALFSYVLDSAGAANIYISFSYVFIILSLLNYFLKFIREK